LEWGMVNQVGESDFQTLVMQVAGSLASGPREAFAAGKQAFNHAVLSNLEEILNSEAILQEEAGKSAEHREGVEAFLGKRKPDFK
jgi:2-(1,2-epoxy-1,2-dihydrophenyl)acetyl-CoA isomerase